MNMESFADDDILLPFSFALNGLNASSSGISAFFTGVCFFGRFVIFESGAGAARLARVFFFVMFE